MLLGTFHVLDGRRTPEFHSSLVPLAFKEMGMGWDASRDASVVISTASLDSYHFFDDTLLTDAGVFHTWVLTPILQIETVLFVSKVSEMHLFGDPCLTECRTRQ
jgi:hypothetical protein